MLTFEKRSIQSLSSGEVQKVHLARALAQGASVYLLDEPFANLDIGATEQVVNLLKSLRDEGKTIIMSVHDLVTAKNHADWIYGIKNGQLHLNCPANKLVSEQQKIRELFQLAEWNW